MKKTQTSFIDNDIVFEDLLYIYNNLNKEEIQKFRNSTILMTGCGGFLGFYIMHFFAIFAKKLKIKRVIGVENFLTSDKEWLHKLASESSVIDLYKFDIIDGSLQNLKALEEVDFVIHAASIASPSFYRKYPLETIDANVTGLRRLLDFFINRPLKGFLFLSSSEIYGDPTPENIPTMESYRGHVSSIGPRACYDEAKRFCETLCYTFANQYNFPISIARPFNNYGPGMSPFDKRLPADFAYSVISNKDLTIYSDGKPTRTFCYVADAICGYLKVLLFGQFDVFNIGIDENEVSVKTFASKFAQQAKKIFNYQGKVDFKLNPDKNYLTDNPVRRCPDITKARQILDYNPKIGVDEGINRYLTFLKNN